MRHKRLMTDMNFRRSQNEITEQERSLAKELRNSSQYWRILSKTINFKSPLHTNNYAIDDLVSNEFQGSCMTDSETGQGFIHANALVVPSVVAFLKHHGCRFVTVSPIASDLCYLDDCNLVEPTCKKCGTRMAAGKCCDETCPFSDRYQWQSFTEG